MPSSVVWTVSTLAGLGPNSGSPNEKFRSIAVVSLKLPLHRLQLMNLHTSRPTEWRRSRCKSGLFNLGNHAEAYLAKNEDFAKAFQSRSVGRRASEFGTFETSCDVRSAARRYPSWSVRPTTTDRRAICPRQYVCLCWITLEPLRKARVTHPKTLRLAIRDDRRGASHRCG